MQKIFNRLNPDAVAIITLILLCGLFFWRLLTPIDADQASLTWGDFSGQFVAFGAYQYERFSQSEVPIWNPYNNSGLPFIADTQAAVFYPPRLATIFLVKQFGNGWSYNALQMEMIAHVLAYSLFMHLFIRRLTRSVLGAFIGAVIMAYGGWTSGYPPLQLALLEAAIWLPLASLGILEATRADKPKWSWLVLTGWALGMSWMAGHPQTSWFLTYFLGTWWAFRSYRQRYSLINFVGGVLLFGAISFGITAVQFIPGIEYLMHTTRSGLGFDAKGNGFPFQDVAQFLFPGSVSIWSPLYFGIVGLVLAVIGIWKRGRTNDSLFWGVVALVALGYSFGANTVIFHSAYNLIPGARSFRGQERGAFLVANSLAVLAGIGVSQLHRIALDSTVQRKLRYGLLALLGFCLIVATGTFLLWFAQPDEYGDLVRIVFFSLLISTLIFFLLPNLHKLRWGTILLAGLVVFELFTVNMDNSNYDSIPPSEQLSITPPPLIEAVLEDESIFRVDGFRGLQDNYGSLYGVMDMRGISPLFLTSPHRIIYQNYVDNPLAWELFAVKYVYSESDRLSIESEVITTGNDHNGFVYLHELENPRPFAHLITQYEVLDSDEFAFALLQDSRFNPREKVILNAEPQLAYSASAISGTVEIAEFLPETITLSVDTPENALLTLAHPDYPGWQATRNDEATPLLRAYGALTTIEVPAGQYEIHLQYNPTSYRLGRILSMIMWGGVMLFGLIKLIQR